MFESSFMKTTKKMNLIRALRTLDADSVLLDREGKAWTAEDLEYTLIDDVRDRTWNSQPVQVSNEGIYRLDEGGTRRELLYLFPELIERKS